MGQECIQFKTTENIRCEPKALKETCWDENEENREAW
jgi:hypothetical protein